MINIYVIEYFAILGSSIFLIRTWWVTHGLLLGNVFNYHKHQYLSPRDTNWTNIIWFHHEADQTGTGTRCPNWHLHLTRGMLRLVGEGQTCKQCFAMFRMF